RAAVRYPGRHRLRAAPARPGADGTLAPPAGASAWRLDSDGTGTVDGLLLRPFPEAERALAAGEVRMAGRAAGANFRDALLVLGMIADDRRLFSEGAGVVVEVGLDVPEFAPGDRVMGLFPDGTGPVAVTDHRLLAPVPPGWTFAQAAAAPVPYLTAYYGLRDLARLRGGESLLIHAATGGVGMAASRLAAHWGATVYGTASPVKWGVLRGQGLDDRHIASSRTLDFEAHFRSATGGRGFDVVLNALAGEFIDASLRLLQAGGRFIEMGKTDVRDEEQVGGQHPGIAYRVLDLADPGPDRIKEIFAELSVLFADGTLAPLPVTAWDMRHAPEAIQHLSQARHTGKIVATFRPDPDPDGTVLITGGTGGLGAALACHMARSGARHLLLASRRGADAPGAAELARDLAEAGADVTIAACDVSDRAALAALLTTVPERHPLTVVVHAAGALLDGTIPSLTPRHLDVALGPKADAAWYLHELTRDLDLSDFVLFSSASGVLGAPGQGNYAAANAFLDALACHRRVRGLPATSLAWGYWAEASGMTGHLTQADRERLERGGVLPISSADGLALFDAARTADRAMIMPVRLDLRRLRTAGTPALLRGLLGQAPRSSPGKPAGMALPQRLAGLPESDQRARLLSLVRDHVATVLEYAAPDEIDAERAFRDLGFDSLTAVELRNRLAVATGLRLPATLVFDHPTALELTAYLRDELCETSPARPPVLDDLDRLVTALRTPPDDSELRAEIGSRLRTVIRLWNDVAAAEDDDGLGAATDDELFAAIDNELGLG
ncbi:MAG: type I polyketide synthase, partial [Trebonia sp.]